MKPAQTAPSQWPAALSVPAGRAWAALGARGRLAGEGTTYAQVIDELRRSLALQ